MRTCTGDGSTPSGQWNGAAPQCPRMFYYMVFDHMILYTTAVDCGTPPSITNGSPGIPTTTTFTGTVTYSCNDGYALFGIATISTCQANATWSRPPECRGTYMRTYIHCLLVECILHSSCILIRILPVLVVLFVVMICTHLMDLANGGIAYNMELETIDNRPVDTVATYTCGTGYTLNGTSTRTCETDGMWSGSTPTCEGL